MNEESIFAAALQKTPSEREAFLNEACQGNAELRAQVEELFQASAAAGSFFEHPPAGLDVTVDAAAHDTHKAAGWDGSLAFLKPCHKPGRIGRLVGNAGEYEIIEVIGSGGMGIVLRGCDTKLRRVVAVKVLAPELARNPTAVKRFLREAKAAAAVVHDHVVTIHNVEETHQPPFLVMQYIDGQTLQQKIDRGGALELKEILRIGCQTAAGLAAAHKHGLVHRDVKPANILLENGVERVKITDFGLARAADDLEITQTGLIAGTPQYMSPEQARGEPIDARSDLFSLGSVLYTMCTGRPAFRAETTMGVIRRVCDDDPRPIREVNAEMPPWLEGIVSKLLAKNPSDRFQSAAEVSELLGQCLAHVQNPASVPLPAPVGRSPTQPPVRQFHGETSAGPRRPSLVLPLCLMLLPLLLLPAAMIVSLLLGWGPTLFLAFLGVPAAASILIGLILLVVRLAAPQPNSQAAATPRRRSLVLPVCLALLPLLLIPVLLPMTIISGSGPRLSLGLILALSGVSVLISLIILVVRLVAAQPASGASLRAQQPAYPGKPPAEAPERSSATPLYLVVCALLLLPLAAAGLLLGWYVLVPVRARPVSAPLLGPAKVTSGTVKLTAPAHSLEGEWIPLFNGQDLSGWKTHPNQPGDWKVENGMLVGSGRVATCSASTPTTKTSTSVSRSR
jgi:serine/threonine protein kinase